MHTYQTGEEIYTDGSYLDRTGGTWHLEDAPFKAKQIVTMLTRHSEVQPNTICEIGCGAGGILSELQKVLPSHTTFTGYEISPQAHAISERFSSAQCQYVLGDAFADSSMYDLVLVMDVVEHVEDCFSFLRQTKQKGRWKIYHIPLDAHVSATLRGINAWDIGHIHLFSIETALNSVELTGHRVVDWMLTAGALAKPNKAIRTRIANLVRLPLAKSSAKLAARLIGGYSILILAE
jgi:cyclopropane fatty-acyl-phospholipid synthase-like methyltransferase